MDLNSVSPPSCPSAQTKIAKLVSFFALLATSGLAFCFWIQQNRAALPAVSSKAGKALLRQYQAMTHDIWLILLMLVVSWIAYKAYIARRIERNCHAQVRRAGFIEVLLRFIQGNPFTAILLIAYAVSMVVGTTYLYKDMIGWYPDLIDGHLLDNFSIKGSLIKETMRRTDYRFFPLAHQDIHILSWFTIHIRVWMLFNAVALVGVVLSSMDFLNQLKRETASGQSTLLLLTALFLIHPSTSTAFFHVIYCERMLCLVFALYIASYARYRNTRSESSFYLTILWALIGIYIKDIALVLFVIPPACLWVVDRMRAPSIEIAHGHLLEKCLCSLSIVFITSYVYLACIPSVFAATDPYNSGASHAVTIDLRIFFLAAISTGRVVMISLRRLSFSALDAVNAAAFAYAMSLALTYSFEASSYLSLPVQMIAVINICWIWISAMERIRPSKRGNLARNLMAVFASCLVILLEHIPGIGKSFASAVVQQKLVQDSIQKTYTRLHELSRSVRESGDDVVIIIEKSSRFSARRHLSRIPYRSLVEYDGGEFSVSDGVNKGRSYVPRVGDIIVNFGGSEVPDLRSPVINALGVEVLYLYDRPYVGSGIFRIDRVALQ